MLMRILDVLDQIPHTNFQRGRNPQERVQADPLFSPLNLSHIDRMKIGLFRQFFLAEPRADATFPYCIAQSFKLSSRVRHRFQQIRKAQNATHPTWVYFFLALDIKYCIMRAERIL